MARVKQRDSLIEVRLRSALWRAGVRYRKHARLLGTPDLILRRARIVIFVDSCFWHGCRYHFRRPKSNVDFWVAKINRNRLRDRRVNRFYRRLGWTVIRFWEHQLGDVTRCVERVQQAIASSATLGPAAGDAAVIRVKDVVR